MYDARGKGIYEYLQMLCSAINANCNIANISRYRGQPLMAGIDAFA